MGKKRVGIALVGVVLMLFAGFIYAWSILSAPIAADFPQWTNAQLSLTFTVCMAFFCLGSMGAGLLAKRWPVRCNVRLSAVLFLAGFLLASRTQSPPLLYVGYGVLGGAGSGFAYNSVMNVIPRWFPDRQGLISGVLLMGFGASSMVVGAAFTALTPETSGAWRGSLLVMGVLIAVLLLAGSFCFQMPTVAELPPAGASADQAPGLELTPGKMLRRGSFWLFFLWALIISVVGLVVIAQARNVALAAAPGLGAGTLSLVVGLISVCNGLGRVIFGGLFDKIGRRPTMLLVSVCALLGAAALCLSLRGSAVLLVAGFLFTGLGYGGGPTLCAAVIKSFYGRENYPVNFSIVNLNLLAASTASTAAGAMYDATGSFAAVFLLLFVLIAAAFGALLAIRKP